MTRQARLTVDQGSGAARSPGPAAYRWVDWRTSEPVTARQLRNSLLVSLLIGGAGTSLSVASGWVLPPAWGVLPLAVLWVFLLSGFVYFVRTVPIRSLFAFRASDAIWGVGFSAVLRLLEGHLSGAASAPFPASTSQSLSTWIGEVAIPAGLIGPVVEEFYFRAFLAVAVFKMLARYTGVTIAGLAATCVSAGAFVLLHACFAPLGLIEAVLLAILGASCTILVVMTGRIWGAVILHVSYNLFFVAVSGLGAVLS